MDEAVSCPFRVGQRIHELAGSVIFASLDMNRFVASSNPYSRLDETRPDAIVTVITDKGFTYTYDIPVSIGRAAWGQMMVGGECFPEGYRYWVAVD